MSTRGYFRKPLISLLLAVIAVFSLPATAWAGRTLNIAYDRQDRSLSCEVAALKMALSYKQVFVSEDELMSHVGYDTDTRRGSNWGNPNKGFVGQIDGRQNSSGYGVHWFPIRRAARKYLPQSQAHSWMTVQDLTREIDRGNPIVIWGTSHTRARFDPWRTTSGLTIKAWVGEHTRVLSGYRGSAGNPTHFILMDPSRGRIVWTTKQLQDNWIRFINSGVVVK